jgi:uncharacterized lipoprotein YehR (DUF1307 family)
MKRLLTIALVLILALTLAACGDSNTTPPANNNPTPPQNESPAPSPSPVPAPQADTPAPTDDPGENTGTPQTSDSEWSEFLRLYEEWVDDYIELLQRYSENPLDMTILTAYMESMEKMIEWSEQADRIQSDLSGDDLREYLATMSRIIQKLSQVN